MTDRLFYIDTTLPEEALASLAEAVDNLDALYMMINGETQHPDHERSLEDVLVRATEYLHWLRDRIEQDDLVHVSTMPIRESQVRGRIARVLKSSVQGGQR